MEFVNERFGYDGNADLGRKIQIQSIAFGDHILFADFLPGADESLDGTVMAAVRNSILEEEEEEEVEAEKGLDHSAVAMEEEADGDNTWKDSVVVEEEEVEEEAESDGEDAVADSEENTMEEEKEEEKIEEKPLQASEGRRASARNVQKMLDQMAFIDLDVSCTRLCTSIGSDEPQSEEVRIPPIRVRVVAQKPLYAREILSSTLFDESRLLETTKPLGEPLRRATMRRAATKGVLERLQRRVGRSTIYAVAFLVQYLALHTLLILLFGKAYVRRHLVE